MAKKRMFNYTVLDSDAFLDMPLSAQALYFHLNMRADDDGFIGNPKRIQTYIGASEDDLKLLILKRFVIAFEDGVIVIKHWRMHNSIQKDRYNPTNYQEDLALLGIKENKAYTLNGNKMDTKCFQNGNKMDTKCIQNVSTDIDIDIDIDLDKDIDIDLEKKSISTNVDIPKEKTTKKKSNLITLDKLFNIDEHTENKTYLNNNPKLQDSLIEWLQYKDEKKEYYQVTGLKVLIKKFVNFDREYGTEAVCDLIDLSMSSNYKGIIWDRLKHTSRPEKKDDYVNKWLNA